MRYNLKLAAATAIFLIAAVSHQNAAARPSYSVAGAARQFSSSGACRINRGVKLFCQSVRIYDRMGWEAGRYFTIKKYGNSYDPGRYPGLNRNNNGNRGRYGSNSDGRTYNFRFGSGRRPYRPGRR